MKQRHSAPSWQRYVGRVTFAVKAQRVHAGPVHEMLMREWSMQFVVQLAVCGLSCAIQGLAAPLTAAMPLTCTCIRNLRHGLPDVRHRTHRECSRAHPANVPPSLALQAGLVYGVATEDMDCLTFGAPRVIRHLLSGGKENDIMQFERATAVEQLGLTDDQFIDLCILLGCDYCPSIKGIGPVSHLLSWQPCIGHMHVYHELQQVKDN